jgi:endogenous inhibitor of DNA gyrase (YacG/DUF329 family)
MSLDEDIRLANEAGLSYGYYKAMTYRQKPLTSSEDASQYGIAFQRRCRICGKTLSGMQRKHCSQACSNIWRDRNRRERYAIEKKGGGEQC